MAERLGRILEIDYMSKQDGEMIRSYLERYARYKKAGLFGFALPIAVFSALEKKAKEENCTCSEMVQMILETLLRNEIVENLNKTESAAETNLVTAKVYAGKNRKSTEQIKQYLHQKNRLPGVAKIF